MRKIERYNIDVFLMENSSTHVSKIIMEDSNSIILIILN